MKKNMLRKTLVIGIVVLFFGASVVSSTGNIIEDVSANKITIESTESYEEILSRGNIAYGYVAAGGLPEGPCYFPLDNPGNITSLAPTESGDFLRGGTWTCDNRWFAIEYNTGILWEIDPETGDMWPTGGGGSWLCGLSYDPVNEKLYKACGSAIFEINITTWEQYLICDLSGEPNYLIGIAFDKNGILYGWDTDSLWIIDIETCEATFVFPFGIHDSSDCCFDFDTNKFYCTAYFSVGQLYEIDLDTGNCILVGSFEGGAEITDLTISFDCENHPPSKPIINGPTHGKVGVEYTYTFNSTDFDGDSFLYYVDWGDGDTEWTEYGDSGVEVTLKHTWEASGKYSIKAQAIDIHGGESEWAELEVTMPRDKATNNVLFWRLLVQFPLLREVMLRLTKG